MDVLARLRNWFGEALFRYFLYCYVHHCASPWIFFVLLCSFFFLISYCYVHHRELDVTFFFFPIIRELGQGNLNPGYLCWKHEGMPTS